MRVSLAEHTSGNREYQRDLAGLNLFCIAGSRFEPVGFGRAGEKWGGEEPVMAPSPGL